MISKNNSISILYLYFLYLQNQIIICIKHFTINLQHHKLGHYILNQYKNLKKNAYIKFSKECKPKKLENLKSNNFHKQENGIQKLQTLLLQISRRTNFGIFRIYFRKKSVKGKVFRGFSAASLSPGEKRPIDHQCPHNRRKTL